MGGREPLSRAVDPHHLVLVVGASFSPVGHSPDQPVQNPVAGAAAAAAACAAAADATVVTPGLGPHAGDGAAKAAATVARLGELGDCNEKVFLNLRRRDSLSSFLAMFIEMNFTSK